MVKVERVRPDVGQIGRQDLMVSGQSCPVDERTNPTSAPMRSRSDLCHLEIGGAFEPGPSTSDVDENCCSLRLFDDATSARMSKTNASNDMAGNMGNDSMDVWCADKYGVDCSGEVRHGEIDVLSHRLFARTSLRNEGSNRIGLHCDWRSHFEHSASLRRQGPFAIPVGP